MAREDETAVRRPEPPLRAHALHIFVAVSLFAAALAWFQSRSPFLESADYGATDLAVALFGDQREGGHDRLALALIREETLIDAPAYAPIDRRILAQTIRELDQLGAAVIGLDIIFDKPTDPDVDAALLEAIRGARTPIVLGRYQDRSGERTIPAQRAYQDWFLGEARRPSTPDGESRVSVGFVDIVTELDGVVRRHPTPFDDAPDTPSFAEALARASGVEGADGDGRIALLRSPLDGSDTFSRLFVEEDLVETSASPAPPEPFLVLPAVEDRIVIIGAALRVMPDYHATPLNVGYGDETLGAEIQAQMTAQLIDGRRVYELGPFGVWAASVIAFALAMTLSFMAHRRWLAEIGVIALLYLGAFMLVFATSRTFLPLVGPAIGWALATIWAKLALITTAARAARRARRTAQGAGP